MCIYEKYIVQYLIECRLLNKLYNTEQVSKVKVYNCGSQKEGNFCETNRKNNLKLFSYNFKEKGFCFCFVYLSYSGNYLNLCLDSNTFVSRDINLICHSARDSEIPLNVFNVLCAAHF